MQHWEVHWNIERADLRNWKIESHRQRSGICCWAFSCTHLRRRSKVAEHMNWLISTRLGCRPRAAEMIRVDDN
eukprot:3101588-Prymnesium_polylepis.1